MSAGIPGSRRLSPSHPWKFKSLHEPSGCSDDDPEADLSLASSPYPESLPVTVRENSLFPIPCETLVPRSQKRRRASPQALGGNGDGAHSNTVARAAWRIMIASNSGTTSMQVPTRLNRFALPRNLAAQLDSRQRGAAAEVLTNTSVAR